MNPLRSSSIASLILISFALLLLSTISFAQPVPTWFRNNEQIHTWLLDLQTRFPNFIRVDSVGHSQQWHLPIWMARISNNAANPAPQDKPKVLIIGQVHAEEMLGTMLTLRLATQICSLQTNSLPGRFRDWRNSLEIYLIPSANPEGLRVVVDSLDASWRKNCRDVNGDGRFTSNPYTVGSDTDGVDINRNFPLNWQNGHPRWLQVGAEDYDYYRGEAPGSETETAVLMRLAEQLKPVYSIVYHSSRTGSLSEKVYFSWDWAATNNLAGHRPPDYELQDMVATAVANACSSAVGSGFYLPSGSRGVNGCAHDWFYQKTGCIQQLIEMGPPVRDALQPAEPQGWRMINQIIQGTYELFNRVLPTTPSGAFVTGIVTDAVNSLPVAGAEVRVLERHSRVIAPRVTNSIGRYYRPLLAGTYSVQFRKYGYQPLNRTNIILSASQQRLLSVALTPLPEYQVTFNLRNTNNAGIFGRIVLSHPDAPNDTLNTDAQGNITVTLPADTFRVLVNPMGYVAKTEQLIVTQDSQRVNLVFLPVAQTFAENFENGTSLWQSGGNIPWGLASHDSLVHTGAHSMADSPFYADPPDAISKYSDNSDGWIATAQTYNFSSVTDASISWWMKGALETEHDSVWLEVATADTNWVYVQGSMIDDMAFDWQQRVINLHEFAHQSAVRFRIRMKSDALLSSDGIYIDDIEMKMSTDTGVTPPPAMIHDYSLESPYPNPFNSQITIPYSVSRAGFVNFTLYDQLGRQVRQWTSYAPAPGKHVLHWNTSNGTALSSGVYYIRMQAEKFSAQKKAILIK